MDRNIRIQEDTSERALELLDGPGKRYWMGLDTDDGRANCLLNYIRDLKMTLSNIRAGQQASEQ